MQLAYPAQKLPAQMGKHMPFRGCASKRTLPQEWRFSPRPSTTDVLMLQVVLSLCVAPVLARGHRDKSPRKSVMIKKCRFLQSLRQDAAHPATVSKAWSEDNKRWDFLLLHCLSTTSSMLHKAFTFIFSKCPKGICALIKVAVRCLICTMTSGAFLSTTLHIWLLSSLCTEAIIMYEVTAKVLC